MIYVLNKDKMSKSSLFKLSGGKDKFSKMSFD